jgi:hypothetical protein
MNLPVQNGQELARDRLPILGHMLLVDGSMQRSNQLISILFNDESDKLLSRDKLTRYLQARTSESHLCHKQISLHDEVRIQGVFPRRMRIVEHILNDSESGLPKSRATILMGYIGLRLRLLEP